MKNLQRLVKISAQRITRNPYHALAAFLVMFFTFFVVGAFVLVSFGSNVLLHYFESRPAVTAFLKDGTTTDKVKSIQDTLAKTQVVSKTRYVSKEEALKIYKERNKNQPLLSEFVTADVLPASIEVSTYKIDDLSKVASILQKNPDVEEVVFQQNIIETLSSWTRALRNIGGGVVAFLLVTSLLTTLIVVGLNISLHRDEIEIMRLVGATAGYIRTPFIFEGIFYGAVSAAVATTVLWGIIAWFSPALQRIFSGIPLFPVSPAVFGYLLLFEIAAGVAVGVIGSFVATRKYLMV